MECKINNLSINYEVVGEGKPIVMLHGYYEDHRVMAGCMEPILSKKTGYKRIYIDLPGMGESEVAEWICSSDHMLDIVIAFIQKIIPNENFLLAGQSYGGYLARGVIYKMAERVEGALLVCPVIIAEQSKRNVPPHIVLVKDEKSLAKLTPKDAEEFNAWAVVQTETICERYENEVMSGIRVANGKFLKGIWQNSYAFSFDVDQMARPFDKPVLVLVGKQDNCVGYKDAWNILENFPRATFAVLDKAGHNLQIEQEKLFSVLTAEWFQRIEERQEENFDGCKNW